MLPNSNQNTPENKIYLLLYFRVVNFTCTLSLDIKGLNYYECKTLLKSRQFRDCIGGV